jgi:GntR family transcriptional repressor for pyruvate dehydrogenase complex
VAKAARLKPAASVADLRDARGVPAAGGDRGHASIPATGPPRRRSDAATHNAGERTRLSDQLYGRVFEDIVSGRYAVGDRLPTETELAEAWGVSRPVVREALLRLRADGLVVSHQGLGTFVSTQPAPRIRTYARAQDVASYLRCQEVRIALESDAARLAALRRTDEQLVAIEHAHETFARGVREGRMVAEEDLAFHARIVEAAGNDVYPQVLATIHETLLGFMRLTLSLTRTASRQRGERVIDEHRAIVAAIRDGDGDLARAAMMLHLSQARRRLVDRGRDV